MFLWDILFPRRCLSCGRYGAYICMDCANSLKPLHSQYCLYCGRQSPWGLTHPACREADGIDAKISLFYYSGALKKIIAGLKYRLVKDALPDLAYIIGRQAGFLTGTIRCLGYPPLQPIPLSRRRTHERGFNQAAIISRIFTSLLPLSQVDVLARSKDALPQAGLSGRRARKANVRNVFTARNLPLPPALFLVDDVITTGATVREAARTLKTAGVKKVFALSVAKG